MTAPAVNVSELTQDMNDLVAIITGIATANPTIVLSPALDLAKSILEKLPPLDASALDPVDRAEADASVEAEESKT